MSRSRVVLAIAFLMLAAVGTASPRQLTASTVSAVSPQADQLVATASTTVVVRTRAGRLGTYLTDKAGRTLYLWKGDTAGKSQCTGACAKAWPPLLGRASAGGEVAQSALATIARGARKTQVTYHGHPLYYFSGDVGAGTTRGQGSRAFGARWWALTSAGTAITRTPSSVTITTAMGALGTHLTDGAGRTLYLWEGDPQGRSACTGACAAAWPPVRGIPHAAGGVAATGLATLTRSDGSLQVTYRGHPLYYFAYESAVGATDGQGSTGFGAYWWAVDATGAAITG